MTQGGFLALWPLKLVVGLGVLWGPRMSATGWRRSPSTRPWWWHWRRGALRWSAATGTSTSRRHCRQVLARRGRAWGPRGPSGAALPTPSMPADLRRFRTYQGTSVRDLLRAVRNKVCSRAGVVGAP